MSTASTSSSAAASPVLVVDGRVECAECGYKSHVLVSHVYEAHGLLVGDYVAKHPGAATVSAEALAEYKASTRMRRSAIPVATELKVTMMGLELPVDGAVAGEECLPLPDNYRFPTKGKARTVYGRAVRAMARGRHAFIWGMPGTGKDAVVHAYSALTRKPVVMVTFRPGTDLAPWFYTRSIDADGTGWEFGHLWRAMTEGIKGRDGVARAALVLLSDVDRADSAQAEWFRILTDSISGRILGPSGQMVPLFPGTQFICTANSCGTGDARGRMASSNPIDASIMDRLGRKIEATYLHWDDEGAVLRAKYPAVYEAAADIFEGGEENLGQLGAATASLRAAIEAEELYAEFTHRSLCAVLDECADELHYRKEVPNNLLKYGFRAWLDGLDADSRLVASRLIDAHLKGGALSDE